METIWVKISRRSFIKTPRKAADQRVFSLTNFLRGGDGRPGGDVETHDG